jgi:predicted dehydrogenase
MYSIVLIGAGNIGSRHLQGLALLKMPATVYVVDPVQSSLDVAKTRFDEVYKGGPVTVNYCLELPLLKQEVDLVIIATNSKIRKDVFGKLVSKLKVKKVVFEKFLFQDPEEYSQVSSLLEQHQIKAWVNCPRRLFIPYQEIKDMLKAETRFEFSISGSSWGLGCNSIHYLDLMAFFSESYDWKVDTGLLDSEVIESKRQGYIEFTGSLSLKDNNGNTGIISSYKKEGKPINIIINTDRYSVVILEKGVGSILHVIDKYESKTEIRKFDMPFLSQLTNQIAEEILVKDTTSLTTYQFSRILHESMLKGFIPFLQKYYNDKTIRTCPIT